MKTKEQIQQTNDRLSRLSNRRWNSNLILIITGAIFLINAICYLAIGKQNFPGFLHYVSGTALVAVIITGIISKRATKQRDLLDVELLKDTVERRPVPRPLPPADQKWPSWVKDLHAKEAADQEKDIKDILGMKDHLLGLINQRIEQGHFESYRELVQAGLNQIDRLSGECMERERFLTTDLPRDIVEEREDALEHLTAFRMEIDHLQEIIKRQKKAHAPKVVFLFENEDAELLIIKDTIQGWRDGFRSDPNMPRTINEGQQETSLKIRKLRQTVLDTVNGYFYLRVDVRYWKAALSMIKNYIASHRYGSMKELLETTGRISESENELDTVEQLLIEVEQSCYEATLQTYSPARYQRDKLDFDTAVEQFKKWSKLIQAIDIAFEGHEQGQQDEQTQTT